MNDASINFKKIKRTSSIEEFNVYAAGLEWSLVEPIVIEDDSDLHSKIEWGDKVSPYEHQVKNLVTFCRRLPVTLLADDVGLGKTISAGLIISELMSRSRVTKVLIVCPKLLMSQWEEELKIKFGINSIKVIGKELILAIPPDNLGAVITTYDTAKRYLELIKDSGFEMLILDEAHKLRNLYGVESPPQVAVKFRDALSERIFRYVLMLTATPIQNRLWDIYSLVEILAKARGHENPFGTDGMFARNFISDSRSEARKLKLDKKEEFRSIVYSYMSRTRRSDILLLFPERKVYQQVVIPNSEELKILELIKEPIKKMNRLVQISILQAFVSSPHALSTQLEHSAENGTIPRELAVKVKQVVEGMKSFSKIEGLKNLIKELRKEQGEKWRIVIFTERRETQAIIEFYLNEMGIKCGIINGESTSRNSDTINAFKEEVPKLHVIISTRAGSEGVNLQSANVLVNFDLPWNPMIVEQRIGRIQRLASKHAYVCIYNIILGNTFEEYIVGRLMEKLQMASNAIGDIESLLEVSGMDEEGEEGGFQDKILKLVLASLEGQDTSKATELAETSILKAKEELKNERQNIDNLLGGMDGAMTLGPKCPKLPKIQRKMQFNEFTEKGLLYLGYTIITKTEDWILVKNGVINEKLCYEKNSLINGTFTLCRPGAPYFERLVTRVISEPLSFIEDKDEDLVGKTNLLCKSWCEGIAGNTQEVKLLSISRYFEGNILLRVTAFNAHDKYERLLSIPIKFNTPFKKIDALINSLGNYINESFFEDLDIKEINEFISQDIGIHEFCRFYNERLIEEKMSAGNDIVKIRKIQDDFTPRILVGIEGATGKVYREVQCEESFALKTEKIYKTSLTLIPSLNKFTMVPEIKKCEFTGDIAPLNCFGKCDITGKSVIKEYLEESEVSGRLALHEFITTCAITKKKVLTDEVSISDITGKKILTSLIQVSPISGKKAEVEFFGKCDFTGIYVLKEELETSEISQKKYRTDQEGQSSISGKKGHESEFLSCYITHTKLLKNEGEQCEKSGKIVVPGILEKCSVTNKRVLPEELNSSSITGKKALKEFFYTSSISGKIFLEGEGKKAKNGNYCANDECGFCQWTEEKCHPDDIKKCTLTSLEFNTQLLNEKGEFKILNDLLNKNILRIDGEKYWDNIQNKIKNMFSGSSKVETSIVSQSGNKLSTCIELKTWLGLKINYIGVIYSIQKDEIVGNIVIGKRGKMGWEQTK